MGVRAGGKNRVDLAVRGRKRLHLLDEPVLKQLVALVQNQNVYACASHTQSAHTREVDLLRVDCGDEAQRRRHDAVHLHTLVDHTRDGGLCLTPSCHTHLRQHQVLQTRARAQASHVTRDLLRQLRGGREDDAANALCVEEVSENYVRLMCAQTLDDGEEIRGGLAGAGGSDAEDVTIPDNDGNGLHLNGRGLLVLYS